MTYVCITFINDVLKTRQNIDVDEIFSEVLFRKFNTIFVII